MRVLQPTTTPRTPGATSLAGRRKPPIREFEALTTCRPRPPPPRRRRLQTPPAHLLLKPDLPVRPVSATPIRGQHKINAEPSRSGNHLQIPKMITRFITHVTTRFNPFSPRAKAARLFLTRLPPGARSDGMAITTELLPRTSATPSSLYIKFSTSPVPLSPPLPTQLNRRADCIASWQRTARR